MKHRPVFGWICCLLAGLVVLLLGNIAVADQSTDPDFPITIIEVIGDNPLDASTTDSILAPFIKQQQSINGLLQATKTLETAIREKGYAFHRVVLPPQTLDKGTVQLNVIVFRLGQISVKGGVFYSAQNILASLPHLKTGATINTRQLGWELNFVNNQPFKDLEVNFRQGAQDQEIDATVRVKDRNPVGFYAVLSNTGSRDSGRSRFSLIYQNANLWDLDHSLVASYTTSPEKTADVEQYGLSYSIPLYLWRSHISFFLSSSDVNTGTVAETLDISGSGDIFGATYSQTLSNIGKYQHELQLGITDKFFENDIRFNGLQIGVDVRSRPLSLRYQGHLDVDWGKSTFYLEVLHNLTSGRRNSRDSYEVSRTGAKPNWDIARVGGSLEHRLPNNWLFRLNATGQYSNEPLISGEQFGVGGAKSVRGYEERELSGDSGYNLRLELWGQTGLKTLFLYGFFDHGRIFIKETQPDENDDHDISSLGLGLNWTGMKGLNLMAEMGHAFSSAVDTRVKDNRGHVNAVYSF